MKILVVSDLHYRLKQFDWILVQAERFDSIIIAGDLLDISSNVNLSVQIEVLNKYLCKLRQQTQVLVCSGNHDGDIKNQYDEFEARWIQRLSYDNIHVDGTFVYWGQTLVSIFPWWDGEFSKQVVNEQFQSQSQLNFQQWIWVYHAPPDNSPVSWTGKRHIGDSALNAWIDRYQPSMVFSGHIHQSPYTKAGDWKDQIGHTWVFNSGSYLGDIPPYLVVDLQRMQAEWHSLAGSEYQLLV